MQVQSTRSFGVQVNGAPFAIEPGSPVTLPEGAESTPHIRMLIDSGDLFVVGGSKPVPEAPVDTTGTKLPSEILADVKSGKAAKSSKPVPELPPDPTSVTTATTPPEQPAPAILLPPFPPQ